MFLSGVMSENAEALLDRSAVVSCHELTKSVCTRYQVNYGLFKTNAVICYLFTLFTFNNV